MAKNQTNKNSKSVCEKIKNAVNISPFRKTHRTTHHPQSNTSANPPLQTKPAAVRQPSSGNIIPIESGPKTQLLDEKEDRAKPHASMNKKVLKILSTGHNAEGKMDKTKAKSEMSKQGGNPMPKVEPGKPLNVVQEWQLKPKVEGTSTAKTTVATKEKPTQDNGDVSGHVNDKFSAYITRVRGNMRTSSDLGIERTATKVNRRDSFNDKVTSFLNRARIKIRTTSNVGDHKRSNSFKG